MKGMWIPGIEQPVRCMSCPCYDKEVTCWAFHRELTQNQIYVKRPEDCKAVFTTDHGDLIDRKRLLLQHDDLLADRRWDGNQHELYMVHAVKTEDILAAPAVIPEEEQSK